MVNTTYEFPRSIWRIGRWVGPSLAIPVALWACTSHPLSQPDPQPEQLTDATILVAPMRHLDLLFMIDNSPSMGPKQDKMKEQFPKLIDALRDPVDGKLPDLRVAILDSDLGSGTAHWCTGFEHHGDLGKFQVRDPAGCKVKPDALWLEYTHNEPVNFTGDVSIAFKCLASGVGVEGCGFEHQLQALQWAFYLSGNESQWNFLRPEAYLGIVILTDEDDCSAPMDSHMFDVFPPTESPSLRCATRGHQCSGATLTYPTTAAVSVPWESCSARDDATCDSSVDTSQATPCNPLSNIKTIADAVKGLKGTEADDKILVAAIYGMPRAGDATVRPYKIDMNPNAYGNNAGYDYWPICYDPNHMPTSSGWDKAAAENGAAGGLRISAFLNQFNDKSRLAYSICESDFGPAMAGIGKTLRNKIDNLCVPFKLVDTSDEPGIQANCRIVDRIPRMVQDSTGHWTQIYDESPNSIPRCQSTREPECWEVKFGNPNGTDDEKETATRCPAQPTVPSQMINVLRKPGTTLVEGTKIRMQCRTCVDLTSHDLRPIEGCDY
jgi:hypothetical protein